MVPHSMPGTDKNTVAVPQSCQDKLNAKNAMMMEIAIDASK